MSYDPVEQPVYHNPNITVVYYLFIPHPKETRCLLIWDSQARGWVLPHTTPQEHHFGVVHHLNAAVEALLGLAVSTCGCLWSEFNPETQCSRRYYAMDTLDTGWAPSEGQRWVALDELESLHLLPGVYDHLVRWFGWYCEPSPMRVEWMRPGWFARAARWMFNQLDRMRYEVIGPVKQQRAWARSATLYVQTFEGGIYMKSVTRTFSYEPIITRVLAQRYPANIPEVLVVDVAHSWMLMHEVRGQSLNRVRAIEYWELALRRYAEIQQNMIRLAPNLISLGIPDRNVDSLAAHIDYLLADLPDSLTELEALTLKRNAARLRNMCYDLLEYRVPLSLEHGDFWAGNIMVTDDENVVFFDWSDSAVAHPFFDLAFFLSDMEDAFPNVPDVKNRLRDVYLKCWTDFEPMYRLQEAYALAVPLTYLHRAIVYTRDILPDMGPQTRWEIENRVPDMLRKLIAALEKG